MAPSAVTLEFFYLAPPLDILGFTRPGQSPTPIDKDSLARWRAASAALSAKASAEGISPAIEAELADLGSAICETAYGLVRDDLERDALLYLCPQGDPKAGWCMCEDIVWEAARKGDRFLVDRDIVVVRGYGDATLEPIDTAGKPIKVLFIGASPVGAGMTRLDLEGALGTVRQAWATWLLAPEERVVNGAGTCEQLERLAAEDPEWDIVHVVAHGSRSSGSVQLEGRASDSGGHGSPDWVEFGEFAHLLGRLQPPRLITLTVCDSSRLALELMEQFGGGTRVMALLARGSEDSVLPFFARFYERLFRPAADALPDGPVYVEQAYLEAARHLRRQRMAQWFLPVLYAPATRTALFVVPQAECQLRGILDRVEDNWGDDEAVGAALDDLKGLFNHESPAVQECARKLSQAISRLRDAERNYEQLLHDIRVRRPWSAVYDDWHALPVTIRRDFSPAVVDLDTAVISGFDTLRRTLHRLEELSEAAVAAVRDLARFEGGELAALGEGCERLQSVFANAGGEAASLASGVFEQGVTAALERCSTMEPSSATAPVARLAALAGITSLLDASGPRFLPEPGVRALMAQALSRADELVRQRAEPLLAAAERELGAMDGEPTPLAKVARARAAAAKLVELQELLPRVHEQAHGGGQALEQAVGEALGGVGEQLRARARSAREQLARVPVPHGGPPPALLEPGKRLELWLWLRDQQDSPGQGSPALEDIPEEPGALSDYAAGLAERLQPASSGGPRTCVSEMLPLLANEEAPLVLAADVDDAAHPYLCLHRFGVRPGTSSPAIRDQADFEVPKETDPRKKRLLDQALNALGNDRGRLAADIHLVPCADAEALTGCLRQAVADVLAGRGEPDLSPLDSMDRATLLAATGATERAAAEAWDAVRQEPTHGTRIHHAFLVAAHHAATLRCDRERFPDAVRRVFALHGMLTVVADSAGSSYLAGWVFGRLTIYKRAMPPDHGEYLDAVHSELRKIVERLLTAFTKCDETCAREAGGLRAEWQAETEGAHLATERKIRVRRHPFAGGYLAARFLSQLDEVGAFIHGAFQRLCTADGDENLRYVTLTGMTPEACQRLVLLFSDLRTAEVRPDAGAIASLAALTPDVQDLRYADTPAGVTEAVRAPDFGARFPVHALLEGAEAQAALLAAHAALLMVKARLAETRRLLGREGVNVADVVAHLDNAIELSQYVGLLGYELIDPIRHTRSALEKMLMGWLYSLQQRLDELNESLRTGQMPRGEEADRAVERLTAELSMADRFALSGRYGIGRGDYGRALTQVHANFGVFLANRLDRHKDALAHVRKAHRRDPDSLQVMTNFVRACGLHALDLKKAGQREEAARILREAIREGRQFLDAHPDAAGEDVEKLRKELRQLESLPGDRPPAPPPALGWLQVDAPDEE